mmetsp:Transcript_57112/g.170224  ORF Transcript_57112/g.170224 Transcript_57112/m.170224 type:complete len:199 (-) Transcript_57112:420-1016(-)|eukprot:CAMPEP_0113552230 /NCGR_PEP_ID=MMETSP0015_2-20120614/14953_1 /TAXON_ID=2838 /ORGANISM="Odontella" /LENGTH=198 /DNA_ID=CAMNT_0000453187 /DNA_START=130 /DNA_END=726 /DNA_ORIENTATION=+ /assembly_acc=CAM_ASM_000160
MIAKTLTILVGTVLFAEGTDAFGIFPAQRRSQLKFELLGLCTVTERGLTETPEQRQRIANIFEQLEQTNPTSKPLKSEKVNGAWSLQYTTSDSILGRNGSPRIGPIIQRIDTNNLCAENSEVVRYLRVFDMPRKVTARLDPQSDRLTNVQFERFSVGPIAFNAPKSFKGFLDVTFLDDDLRLTRGDKGNIFVLTRLSD